VRIKSFAKVNLGLEVLGLRPDGYHNLRTLFQSVSLADELAFFPESGGGVVLHGSDPSIPWDETNLVFRAARALKDRYPRTPGASIEVTKFIPAGRGLGGGSSNAAMTLLGLDRLWGLGLEKEELMDIGRSLGADVPYFFRGGLCLGLDRGDRIVPLEDLPALPLVIALPPFSCSTADIYREHRLALMTGAPPPGAKLTSPPEDSRIEQFFRSRELRFLENNLEATVFRFHPRLQDLKALFRSRGAELSLVTGSGSAVFGLFRDGRQAEEARRAAEQEYPAVLAETVPRGRYEEEMWDGV
jgi:4-diphosphocytidyl-2-C-methyl-D-erythritol kinase